ncbi:hypothetical protein QYZ87_07695 [Porphyromonadaceae bacterium W3.11]|nr:hypothetical protein [Porphyromonadaceae bacterium W3.11]
MEKLLKPIVKAPGASIERNVKGHDQIYTVSAILRMSIPVIKNGKPADYYAAYGISDIRIPPVPLYQQIDISKDDDGQMKITSERKWFDVIKCNDKDGFYKYSLELKYYDLNGKMINYQFSSYDPKDPEGSNLLHHQHFFTIQSYSLEGDLMYYPTTLDGQYYDEFTFLRDSQGKRIPASLVSASNVYVPVDASDTDPVYYNKKLGEIAAENATTTKATESIEFEGKKYRLYKTKNMTQLNEMAKDIFDYEYRDTDPIDSYLHSKIRGVDDQGRDRSINNNRSFRLQQKRALGDGKLYDYLGFKGMLTFYKSNISFRMRICIAHMLTNTEKYRGKRVAGQALPSEYYQISPSWNNYDIDYPLEFRVIADLDGDKEQFVKDVQKVYPDADREQLLLMFSKDIDWFAHIPRVTM